MNFTRLRRGGIQREHPYTTAETHPHMEELHVQLTVFNIVPQRLFRIVLNGVVCLRGHGRQRVWQWTRRTTPRSLRQIVRHGLQNGEVKATTLTVGNIGICGKGRAGKER
ncbi:hypothetical protein D3C80_793440 [compost metagenome]